MNFWDRVSNLDRRILWAVQMIIVVAILLRPIGLPIAVSSETQLAYDFFDNLPPGSIIWADFGTSGAALVELGPMIYAFFTQAFNNNLRVIGGTLWAEGPAIGQIIFEEIQEEFPDVEYGVDFVNVGYKPGTQILVRGLVDDVFEACRGVDYFARPLADYPLMQEVPRLTADYVDAIIVFAEGSPGGREWYEAAAGPEGIPLIQGTIQMSIPEAMPFLRGGQYAAIIPGNRGAAEYEFLVGRPGEAIATQDANSAMALWLITVLILGNLGFLLGKQGGGKK